MVESNRGRTTEARDKYGIEGRMPILGEVTQVWTRQSTADDGPDSFSNHEANVLLQSDAEEPRRFAIHQDFATTAAIPKPGDFVRVEYVQGTTERPVITGYAYTREDNRPPLAKTGHWRQQFDSLFLEGERTDHDHINVADDYDVLRLAQKSDGLSNPTTEIGIDDSTDIPSEFRPEARTLTDGRIKLDHTENATIEIDHNISKLDTPGSLFEVDDTNDYGIITLQTQTTNGSITLDHTSNGAATLTKDITKIETPSASVTLDEANNGDITVTTSGSVTIQDGSGGSITMENDTITVDASTVKLGSGGNGIITDVSTTKDSDGHVTDITLTRSTVSETE